MGKNTVQTKQWLDKCYPGSTPAESTIKYWFREFKRGRTETSELNARDVQIRLFRQKTSHKIVLADREVKVHEIADSLEISINSVFTILHEHLGMRKWLPKQRLISKAKTNHSTKTVSKGWKIVRISVSPSKATIEE